MFFFFSWIRSKAVWFYNNAEPKMGCKSDCQSSHLFQHPTRRCSEQWSRTWAGHLWGKCTWPLWCAPNEAEETCGIISFDFPTVHLAGLPAWSASLPKEPHTWASPTGRLHVSMLSTGVCVAACWNFASLSYGPRSSIIRVHFRLINYCCCSRPIITRHSRSQVGGPPFAL